MTYATVEQLDGLLGFTPNDPQVLLDRASRDVDRALLCTVYDNTDPVIVEALKQATLEQVAYQLEIGNSKGIAHGLQPGVPTSVSAGGVDLSRGGSVGGNSLAAPWLGSQAYAELQKAGLTAHGPATYLGG